MNSSLTIKSDQIIDFKGEKWMFDHEIARAFGISTGRLNENAKTSIGWKELREEEDRAEDEFRIHLTRVELLEIIERHPQYKVSDFNYNPYIYTKDGAQFFSQTLDTVESRKMARKIWREWKILEGERRKGTFIPKLKTPYQRFIYHGHQCLKGMDEWSLELNNTRSQLSGSLESAKKMNGAMSGASKEIEVQMVIEPPKEADTQEEIDTSTLYTVTALANMYNEKYGLPMGKYGKKLGSRTVNKILIEKKLQSRVGDTYEYALTNLGKKYGHSCLAHPDSTKQRVKWYKSVFDKFIDDGNVKFHKGRK